MLEYLKLRRALAGFCEPSRLTFVRFDNEYLELFYFTFVACCNARIIESEVSSDIFKPIILATSLHIHYTKNLTLPNLHTPEKYLRNCENKYLFGLPAIEVEVNPMVYVRLVQSRQ